MADQATEIEDPIAFLTSLREICPDVTSMLNSKQAKLLSRSPQEPYDSKDVNEQYLVDMASYYGVKQKVEDANQSLRNNLLSPNKVNEAIDVKSFTIRVEVLEKVSIVKLVAIVKVKLQALVSVGIEFVVGLERRRIS